MAILAECPICHKKQAVKNRLCACGADLVKAKRSKNVKYWIDYRVNGKSRREAVGYSIEEARDADGKRRTQKRENRIFDIMPEAKMTFQELTDWYLNLEQVKKLARYRQIKIGLGKFNSQFGATLLGNIQPADIENCQAKRKAEDKADATVDDEIGAVKTMVKKGFENRKVGADTFRTFEKVKKLLKRNSNARDRILSPEEFGNLKKHLPSHQKPVVVMGYWTGMRLGEILCLTWDKVDLEGRFIRLEPEDTKDDEPRLVPIMDKLYNELVTLPNRLSGIGEDNHVFQYMGKPLNSIDTGLKRACERAGILYGRKIKGGFTFHDLRHTFNTNMRKAGVDKSVIMKITGHSSEEMFNRYNTVDAEDAREAVDQLQAYLANVDQNVDQPDFSKKRSQVSR